MRLSKVLKFWNRLLKNNSKYTIIERHVNEQRFFMKRFVKSGSVILVLMLIVSLCGCGSNVGGKEYEQTTISINKDGSVTGVEVDEFESPQYELDELRAMTEDAIKVYNPSGEKKVTLQSLTQKEKQVRMVMHYQSVQDYVDFNMPLTHSINLFYGTIEEAKKAGYLFKEAFISVKDGSTLDRTEIGALGDHKVVITSERVRLSVPSKIVYTSSGVEVLENKKEADLVGTEEELFYIVLK